MRILFFAHEFSRTGGGGVENYLREVTKWLLAHGHEVRVVARRWQADEPVEDEINGVAVRRLAFREVRGLRLLSKPKLVAQALVPRFAQEIASFDPNLIITRMALMAWAAGQAAGSCRHFFIPPCVESLEGRANLRGAGWRERFTAWWWKSQKKALECGAIARAAATVVFSKTMREQLAAVHRLPLDFATVLPPGVNTERFRPGDNPSLRKQHGLGAAEPLVLYVGRLHPQKGLAEFLEAMRRRSSGWRLVLVGSGPQQAHLQDLAASLGNRVLLVGPTTTPEAWYRAADIFVLPSMYEPFGQVLLEAMASGLPCVARRAAPPRVLTAADEIVRDGRTGFLAEGLDTAGLVDRINTLAADSSLRTQLGNAGCKLVLSRYSWGKHCAGLLEVVR